MKPRELKLRTGRVFIKSRGVNPFRRECINAYGYYVPPYVRQALSYTAIRPSVGQSVPYPYLNNGVFYGYGYHRTLIGNAIPQRSVVGADSEAFVRWLHRRYVVSEV